MAQTEDFSCQRFVEFARLPKQMLAPIEGYQEMPLVSLEEAVKPLVNLVEKIDRNVFIVKENCQIPADGLTIDESASIMLYTYESHRREKSLYFILNETLRSENRQKLVPWFLYLRLLLTALARLPSKHLYVNRGVRQYLVDEYHEGRTFIWWGFTSCTNKIKALESGHFLGKSDARTLFLIECHTGKDIKNHSFIRKENEVLLLPARQFKVKSSLDAGGGLHIIQIEEIDPKYPLLEAVPVPEPQKQLNRIRENESKSVEQRKPLIPSVSMIVKESTNKINGQTIVSKRSDQDSMNSTQQESGELGTWEGLFCKGRPCAMCNKCRDWHFTGDQITWHWLRNVRNWKNNDWERWERDAEKIMIKHDGATCIFNLSSSFERSRFRRADTNLLLSDHLHPLKLELCLCELH